jgi:hypothetical protein
MKDKKIKKNLLPDPDNSPQEKTCANSACGKKFMQSVYGQWCDIIMRTKPICSYECNKAIGQVK